MLNDYHSEIEDYNEKIIKPTSVEVHPKFSRSKVVQHDLAIIRFLVSVSRLITSDNILYSRNPNSQAHWSQSVSIQN